MKERILYLGITKMPGKTIFSRIATNKIKDIRFETSTAKEHFKEIIDHLPSDKNEKTLFENIKWYSLSRKHEKDNRIEMAHRDFLLCRDLYSTTVTMLLLTSIGMLVKVLQFSWVPIGYLALMLLITNISAHFKAHRFVNNVIVADLNAS
jgi:hypothetical protein